MCHIRSTAAPQCATNSECPTQGPWWGYFKSQFQLDLLTFDDISTQKRTNGSKNEHGIPPRRTFCGEREQHLPPQPKPKPSRQAKTQILREVDNSLLDNQHQRRTCYAFSFYSFYNSRVKLLLTRERDIKGLSGSCFQSTSGLNRSSWGDIDANSNSTHKTSGFTNPPVVTQPSNTTLETTQRQIDVFLVNSHSNATSRR